MKILTFALVVGLILSFSGVGFGAEDDRDSSTASSALGSAVMGGLLGGGLGAAIGSASGNAGKGALIGAGVGAVGGTLLGASQESNRRRAEASTVEMEHSGAGADVGTPAPKKIKKRIIREYDSEGNVVSEKEVPN